MWPRKTFFRNKNRIYIFCHHRGGSRFLSKIFGEIAYRNNWTYQEKYGLVESVCEPTNVVIFAHSLLRPKILTPPFKGIRIVRDLRDTIVSGYLYHKRCRELWCIHTNHSMESPIMFPDVPYILEHYPETYKINYIKNLKGKSYQENLLMRDQIEGLRFEMYNYGLWTFKALEHWKETNASIKQIDFEKLIKKPRETFQEIFSHLNLNSQTAEEALRVVDRYHFNQMSKAQVESDLHISSRSVTRWKNFFDDQLLDEFNQLHHTPIK